MKTELSVKAKELIWKIANAIPSEISKKLTDNELKLLITNVRKAITS